MGDVMRFGGSDGDAVLIELADARTDEVRRGGLSTSAVVDASKTLEQVIAQLKPLTEAFASEVRVTDGPEEVELEFAVRMSADANLVIAKTTGEANFRMKLRWSRSTH